MGDTKISALTAATAAAGANELPINEAGTSKKLTVAQIRTLIRADFDVRDYGALGTGSNNDTAAFQAAITDAIAANGTLVIPPAPVWWNISDTLNIVPSTVPSIAVMHIRAAGATAGIIWTGGSNKPIFKSVGWRHSTISGLHIQTSGASQTTDNCTAWDLTTSAAAGSSTHLLFEDCRVNFQGLGTGTIGWRLGHDRDGDLSVITWFGCMVHGKTALGASEAGIGWAVETTNALQNQWIGCFSSNLAKKVTNVPTAGAAGTTGGGSMFLYGDGGAYNAVEFEYQRKGDPLLISGGRWEHGTTFLSVDNSADPTLGAQVTVQGGKISAFTANTLFSFLAGGSLVLDNLNVETEGLRAAYSATMVSLGAAGSIGSFGVHGGCYEAGPVLHTVAAGTWAVDVAGVTVQDATNYVTGAAAAARSAKTRSELALTALGFLTESYPRGVAAASSAMTAGKLRGALVGFSAGDVVTTLHLISITAGTSVTLGKLGIYTLGGTLLAATATCHTEMNALTGAMLSVDLTSPYTITATGGYYICALAVGGTAPTIARATSLAAFTAIGAGAAPFVQVAGKTDLADASLGVDTFSWWFGAS